MATDERAIARAQAAALTTLRRRISERDFQLDVEDALQRGGWEYIRLTDSRRQHAVGWPDLVAFRGTCVLAAELKSERGRTTPQQERWLALFREAGIQTFVWRPADWPQIVEKLLAVTS